jgi:hypothetical protein
MSSFDSLILTIDMNNSTGLNKGQLLLTLEPKGGVEGEPLPDPLVYTLLDFVDGTRDPTVDLDMEYIKQYLLTPVLKIHFPYDPEPDPDDLNANEIKFTRDASIKIKNFSAAAKIDYEMDL